MKTEAQELIINAYKLGGEQIKQKLEQAFPELFSPFKNGEWIKSKLADILIRITDFEKSKAYGFLNGIWEKESNTFNFKSHTDWWQKATAAEVIAAFKKEFEKRGFKEGVKFESIYTEGAIENFNGLDFEDFFNEKVIKNEGQLIYSQDYVIYKNGVFAEIVEEPKTIEQRLKTAFIDVFDKATCIQHWHCTGKNNEGMIVSSKHVHELWEVLEKYKSFRNFL